MNRETKEYRIMMKSWYNEYGDKKEDKYYIQRKTSFLRRWVDITHTKSGFLDSYKATTYFKTPSEATEYCKNILCKNKPVQTWVNEVVSTSKCE